VRKAEKRQIPGVIFRAQAMHDAMATNAAMFVSPTVAALAR